MVHFSIESVLSSPTEQTEEIEKQAESKVTSTPLTRISATSLLLARWISSRRASSRQNDSQIEKGRDDEYECPPAESLFPVEDCSYLTERGWSVQVDRTCLGINEDIIRNVLAEHMRQTGCKPHLHEDLKELNVADETNAETFFAACKPNEIDALLLQACFLARMDLIRCLCEHYGADVNHTEPDHNLTPLHLCAFRNCLDGVLYLTGRGASTEFKLRHTPFHYAAFGDAFEVAHNFVQQGYNQESSPDEETVLHVAARTNALRVLSLLAPNSKELDRLDPDGYAAVHHAADGGNPNCLLVLLKAGCQVNLPTTSNNNTALHLAAQGGCAENVTLLVDTNANLTLKNHRGYTALHLAARSHSLECIEILLKGGADPNVEDDEGRTVLHLALGRSVVTDDIVELLLTWRANVNKADKYGYMPLHIAASNEMSQCVNLLIKHEADLSAKTKGGTSALSIVLRKTPTCLDVFERRLDASMTLHRQGFVAGEVQMRMDFRPLLQHRRQNEIGYLNTFVKEGYKEILEHPLCQSFLHLKWQKMRKYYVSRLLFYLMYVLILTFWVMSGLAYNHFNEWHNSTYMDKNEEHNSTYMDKNEETDVNYTYKRYTLDAICYSLIILTVMEVFRKFTVIPSYLSVRQFFTHAGNLLEWCMILSVFAITFVYTGRAYAWQSLIGAFAVLCGWSYLMLMIVQLPVFGIYVAIFTSVQAHVIKLFLAYAWLLVGFTVSFCVIFPKSKAFSNPYMGFIKVLAMMTGELTFDDLFKDIFSPPKETVTQEISSGVGEIHWFLLQISAQICFVLFLLFVTVVLMNLLIGIAVNDIKGLQKEAELAKLIHQTKLISDVEMTLFLALLPKRVTKYLRWTALIMPSPLRAVLSVRPLNPRETRLPRDILSAAYNIAKESDSKRDSFAVARKKTYAHGYHAKASYKSELYSSGRYRRGLDTDTLAQDYGKLKDDIAELRKICEKNQSLLRELARTRDARE